MKTAAACMLLLLLAAGCVAPPQGIDRAVFAARRHLLAQVRQLRGQKFGFPRKLEGQA